MKSEQIKEITDRATEQLVAALNAGRSEALTSYLKAIGRFHRYSLHNVLLIASQKPEASYVAGFRTWNQLGRFVKKGEKGILILAPIVRRKAENEEEHEDASASVAGSGCHHSETASTSDHAQDEFVQAFLTAHDNKDLGAEQKLVAWDGVTESSRSHFTGELKSGLEVKITANIESMPAVPQSFSARYNIPPEKFLVVVYDDPRGPITVKFPIAKKGGRYYLALRKE